VALLTDNLTLRGRTGINVNYHWDLADWEWEWIADSFGWVRFDGAWNNCEATAGTYTWTYIDAWLEKLETYGLGAIIILDYANTVVTSYGFTQWNEGPNTDAQVTAFTNWAVALAAHVAGKNVILEIWNEPHGSGYWYPAPNAADYARLARATTAAIKADYPEQVVLAGGGLAYPDFWNMEDQYPIEPSIRPAVAGDIDTGPYYLEFIKDVARRGGFEGADAVSFHFYQQEWPPEIVKRQLDTLKNYVAGDIVDSEAGVANESQRIGKTGYYRPLQKNANEVIGEDTAALYLVRKVLAQVAHDVKLTALFSWRNIQTDVGTEGRVWPKRPQYGLDDNYNNYKTQALLGSYGLCEADPEDSAQASLNLVDDFIPEYIVDKIDIVQAGSAFCGPTVLYDSVVDDAIVDVSKVQTAGLYDGGTGGRFRVGIVGTTATSGTVNDVEVIGVGQDYTYGFNVAVTDPDAGKATTGLINLQPASYFDDAGSGLLTGTVTTGGEMTGAYLDWSGILPYSTKATATLTAMNVGGVYYTSEDVAATVNFPIEFNGTVCSNGAKAYGWVETVRGGKLSRYASTYGSITLGVGQKFAVAETLTGATSLNGSGSELELSVAALVHTALGIVGSSSSYWNIDKIGKDYQVGEVVTFSTTSGTGEGGVVVVTSVDDDGGVTGVYGLRGGTYKPTALPTRAKMGNAANAWTYAASPWLTSDGAEGSTATITPWFTPTVISVNNAGAGYEYEPMVYITPNASDTGPATDATPYGARARAMLSATDTVGFINAYNSSNNNGAYYTLTPTIAIECGYESIKTRVRTCGGVVTDIFIDGPGVGLSPTQNLDVSLKGGKWPCIVKYTGTWAVESGYAGLGYTNGGTYYAYDIGATIPVSSGDLNQTIWDDVVTANKTVYFTPTCDPTGAVTTLGSATGSTVPHSGDYCVLAPLGDSAAVSFSLRPKPNPKQPNHKATALKDLMGWIGDYTYSENLSTEDKAYHLVFTKSGENDVHVLWRTTESAPTGTLELADGVITGVVITDPGVGLTEEPDVEFISDTGSGAEARVLMFDGGLVSAVLIDDGGTGYTSADTVRFTTESVSTVDVPDGAVRAWNWDGSNVTLGDSITLTDEPLFIEVED
jgi:hypothetical protein